MKVKELIQTLQQEDPEAVVVAIPSRYKHLTTARLEFENKPVYDEVTFAGNERQGYPRVVLIVENSHA